MIESKLLFIHIPKTGGISLTLALQKNNLDIWKRDPNYKHHDSLLMLQKNNSINNNVFKFSVVRNPYTRTYSYYHHFMKINSIYLKFYEFLKIIEEKKFFPKTPLISNPQNFYILNKNNLIGLDKVYRYENMSELENDLNIKLEKKNVGNYTKKEYYSDYEEKNINLVKQLFFDDFNFFNYSFEFL